MSAKRPMCTNPVHCAGIDNPPHRSQFRHQCPGGKTCAIRDNASHCLEFAHDLFIAEERTVAEPTPKANQPSFVVVSGPNPLFKQPGGDVYVMPDHTSSPVATGVPTGSGENGGKDAAPIPTATLVQPSGPQVSPFPPMAVPLQPQVAPTMPPYPPQPYGGYPTPSPFPASQAPATNYMSYAPTAGASNVALAPPQPQPPFPGHYLGQNKGK